MKKKLLSLLLIVMLCCSAVYIFAGCKGGDMSEVGEMTLTNANTVWEFKVDKSAANKSNVEILKDNTAALATTFKVPNVGDSVPLSDMIEKVSVTGLDITTAHKGIVTISYEGYYSCTVPYNVTE